MHKSVAVDHVHGKKLPFRPNDKIPQNQNCDKKMTRSNHFNILDCACVNVDILNCTVTNTQISRREFLLALIRKMCKLKFQPVELSEQTGEQGSSKLVMLQEYANSVSFLLAKQITDLQKLCGVKATLKKKLL